MSILVHQAIEKYVNPTRYRQIIESESASCLTPDEMDTVSKDQKHSSYVAKRIYQKKLSRDVATQGRSCMQKIVGEERDAHTKEIASIINGSLSSDSMIRATEEDPCTSNSSPVIDVEEIMSIISGTTLQTKNEEETCGDGGDPVIEPLPTDVITSAVVMTSEPTVNIVRSTRTASQKDQIGAEEMDLEVKKELMEGENASPLCQKRFCPEEDNALKEGIKKHGLGKWSVMLKDTSLKFSPSRTRDALRMRADTLGLSKNKRNTRKNKTKKNAANVN